MNSVLHLRGGGVSLVIDTSASSPSVIHWGADLGENLPQTSISTNPVAHSAYDHDLRVELVPQASSGWRGRPALLGHRNGGRAFSPLLELVSSDLREDGGYDLTLTDSAAGISLVVTLVLSDEGMLRMRSAVTNLASDAYLLSSLVTVLPVGLGAAEVLDLTGRWCREQHPQRRSLQQGTWLREHRHGRTGHDSSLLVAVGTPAFSNRTGRVWATHLGFSGNHATYVEKTPAGPALIGNSELLAPGEIVLQQGESYETPWTFAVYSEQGMDGVTSVFHSWLRSRPNHPKRQRPVVLNTWEAVYFKHNLADLTELAESAQEIGAERFVLDDGWFRNRRGDRAGLGDWFVDEDVWPDGLAPLIDAVTSRGLEFGLWVEPEMVNVD